MPDLNRTLTEHVHYPDHAPRTPSSLYLKNHHRLVVEEDRPCLVCGVRNSTLHDPARNPCGATAIETHHRLIEWALANAIDLAKFNARVRPGLLRETGDRDKYGHDFTQEEMEEWIAGDADNLWCLCDRHHRSSLIGIHAITGPIWGAQDLIRDGFDLTGFVAPTPHEAAQLTALPQTVGVAQPMEADDAPSP